MRNGRVGATLWWAAALVIGLPATAWAKQIDTEEMRIVALGVFAVPAGLTMIGLLIASIVRLRRAAPPAPGSGQAALILSCLCFAIDLALAISCLFGHDLFPAYVQAVVFLSAPVLLLSLASAILAWRLRVRAKS